MSADRVAGNPVTGNPATEDVEAAIEGILRGAGLTDKPGEFDSDIHSWRCAYPDRYDPCGCFAELIGDLTDWLRLHDAEVAAKALREAADEIRRAVNSPPHVLTDAAQRVWMGGLDAAGVIIARQLADAEVTQ